MKNIKVTHDAKEVQHALENSKNEILKSLAEDFKDGDSLSGGEWVKIKTKFSKGGTLEPGTSTGLEESN
ncbi:hypothetical protein [Chryseobacterium pennipullorum]|uniref:Uncharacterized protein n=1 Tax=Chryseobacterium pennipullorum TaxID=2258963 RepID=A0A3D9B132_9FLAO|nr:hypothetical protein [Chryseobacterium pennipullorum]REC47048.1 hypothetical protein DRF67_12600 [Chryseobacterium pennipullorum]